MIYINNIETPIGTLWAKIEDDELTYLGFKKLETSTGKPPSLFIKLCKELEEYFSGERKCFEIPVKIEGKDFTKNCLKAMQAIPYGQTITYKELADLAGTSKAVRAAGTVCAKNQVIILNPCHRVIHTDHTIGNYGGGTNQKKLLLEHEGIGTYLKNNKIFVREGEN